MKRVVRATGAALIMAAAALTASVTSADAQKKVEKGGHAAVSRGGGAGGAAFRRGQGNVQGNVHVNKQVNSGQISRQFSGQVRSGQVYGGNKVRNGSGHVAQRHARGGPGFYAYGGDPGYSNYGYEYYPYVEDEDCYETQRVWRYGTWQYVRVYVCE